MAEVLRKTADNSLTFAGSLVTELAQDEKHISWIKWVHASINKHFMDRKSTYDMYLEGDERIYQSEAEFAELRIDGPFILQPQKDLYYMDVEINVLIQSHIDPNDLYKIQEAIGVYTKAFTNAICVYRYGDGMFDTGTLLGTFHLKNNSLDINNYGIIREDLRLTQSTIEGHYRLELWTGA